MKHIMRKLHEDECGMILSSELVLVMTIGVLAMVVGLNSVASSINWELNDLASAFSSLRQRYSFSGFRSIGFGSRFGSGFSNSRKSFVSGSFYSDFHRGRTLVAIGGGVPMDSGVHQYVEPCIIPAETPCVDQGCEPCVEADCKTEGQPPCEYKKSQVDDVGIISDETPAATGSTPSYDPVPDLNHIPPPLPSKAPADRKPVKSADGKKQ